MSHNEVWDDSALLESWDEAVQEYKHYHSIHARGENVEEVVHEAEQAETGDKIMNGDEAAPDTGVNAVEELETGDLPNGQAEGGAQGSSHTGALSFLPEQHSTLPSQVIAAATPSLVSLPSGLSIPGDEALKTLMMSWYYAGYYTGLHEGQQKAAQASATAATDQSVRSGSANT
ncbi:hypothetical protein BJ546DRAFT_1059894 [Cryomyces antarcticus]